MPKEPRKGGTRMSAAANLRRRDKADSAKAAIDQQRKWAGARQKTRVALGPKLSDRIDELIRLHGGEVAFRNATGVSHGTLQGWVQHARRYAGLPTLDTLFMVAKKPDGRAVSLDWLAGFDVPMERDKRERVQDVARELVQHVALYCMKDVEGKPFARRVPRSSAVKKVMEGTVRFDHRIFGEKRGERVHLISTVPKVADDPQRFLQLVCELTRAKVEEEERRVGRENAEKFGLRIAELEERLDTNIDTKNIAELRRLVRALLGALKGDNEI